uniref:Protein ROOT PRIMORDIUM DEFECTIVE 1-like n=1 Tax=Rhizophora mucronata TaxID=61149 RepID=A0A2P2QN67_RHIMU
MYLFLVSLVSINLKKCGCFRTTEYSKSSGNPNSDLAIRTCSKRIRPVFDNIISFLNRVTAS